MCLQICLHVGVFEVYLNFYWKVFQIGTVHYNWPMSAHASRDFSVAHCTDLQDLPFYYLTSIRCSNIVIKSPKDFLETFTEPPANLAKPRNLVGLLCSIGWMSCRVCSGLSKATRTEFCHLRFSQKTSLGISWYVPSSPDTSWWCFMDGTAKLHVTCLHIKSLTTVYRSCHTYCVMPYSVTVDNNKRMDRVLSQTPTWALFAVPNATVILLYSGLLLQAFVCQLRRWVILHRV